MGLGIDLARLDNPEHAEIVDNFKDQLIISLVKKLGGCSTLSLQEVDDTQEDLLYLAIKDGNFILSTQRKH